MSTPTSGVRERPQSLPGGRFKGGNDRNHIHNDYDHDGVSVKTLPNSHSSQSVQAHARKVQSSICREDQLKSKNSSTKVAVVTNTSSSSSSSSKSSPNSVSTNSRSKDSTNASTTVAGGNTNLDETFGTGGNVGTSSGASTKSSLIKSDRLGKQDRFNGAKGDKKQSSYYEKLEKDANDGVEVRTHHHSHSYNGRDHGKGVHKSYNREFSGSPSVRSKTSDRSSYPASKASHPHLRSSNRVFTSEKYRNTNQPRNEFSVDYFRRSITEQVLCRILSNVAREDPNHQAIKQLTNYLNDPANSRSIVRSSQNLWDYLSELYSIQGRERKDAKNSLAICLSKAGQVCMKAGNPRYADNQFYKWLFTTYEDSDSGTKCWLMNALLCTLNSSDFTTLTYRAQYIVGEIQRNLDHVAAASEMFSLLKVTLHLAENHYLVFKEAFMDIYDILIGWSIDTDQSEETNKQIREVIVGLHRYWIEDIANAKDLTSNFLDDIDSHARATKVEADAQLHVAKMCLLIRTYWTLVVALKGQFSHKHSMHIEKGYISSSLTKILSAINSLSSVATDLSKIHLETVQCISVMATCHEDLSTVKDLVTFMKGQVERLTSETTVSSILRLTALNKLTVSSDAAALSELSRHTLKADLTSLELSDNIEVQACALDLYRSYFATKDMETIQLTFQNVKEAVDKSLLVLATKEAEDNCQRSIMKAQQLIVFHLSTMTQVATDTNNLILMYAIEPSMFDYLLKDVLLGFREQLKCYSAVSVSVLSLLHLHCSSNRNFIAKSNLCASDTTRKSLHNIGVNRTSGDNFSTLLESLIELFSVFQQNSKGMLLLTQWLAEIIEHLSMLNPPLLNNILVTTLVTHLLSLDEVSMTDSMTLNVAKALSVLVKHSQLNPTLLTIVVDYTLYQLASMSSAVRQEFLHLATLLPVDSFLRNGLKELMKKHNQVLATRRSIMSGFNGYFGVELFRSVANVLFKQYTNREDIDLLWVQRLLLTATSDQDRNSSSMHQVMKHSGLLEHWLLWQAADFCVAHRLRTPIGKPMETFTCIELAIKQIVADTRVEVSPKCGADTKKVWLLLQFIENLEKVLYNAYEGTAGQITTHGKMVRSFFRTNRATCIGWLTRIRLHILNIAAAYGHPATVIRHGYELISDMLRSQRTQTPEFELVLVHLTEAWCQLNCSEAIQGLYEWCKSACGRKLPWLKPFFLKAMNRFEEAAAELQSSLTNMLVPQPVGADSVKLQTRPGPLVAAVNQLTAQQITNCYTSLQSWEDASDWLQQFEALKLENASIVGTDPLNYCDKVMMGRETTPELLTWSKQQHLTDLWMTSVAASSQQSLLDGEESARLHQLVKLETSSDWPTSIQPNTMLTLHSQQMDSCSLNSLNLTDLSAVPSGQTQRLPWLLNLVQLASSQSTSASCSQQVMIACSREARHTGNLKLAGSLMTKLSKTQETASSTLSLRIERESAKQIMCLKNSNLALEKMLAVALQPVSSDSDKELNELVARSTLTSVKWLQAEPQLLQSLTDRVNVEEIPSLSALVSQCAEHVMDTSTAPLADKILGSILVKSTIQCPTLAKTWYHFGNWAYKWGRRCLDNTEHSLSTEEVEQIKSLLPPDLTREEIGDILAVMAMVQGTFTPPDDDLADEAPDYGDDDLQEIRRRLISSCGSLNDDTIEQLVSLWTITARKVYSLYEESAKAYFKYLSLCSNSQGRDHHNVTITLRLLRLLVKHAWELKEVLESELADTPTAPWRSIIPQLFSRLNHPEVYVRQSVSELLIKLADDYPHLIVYPAIVGCNQSARQGSRTISYVESAEEEMEADSISAVSDTSDCFQQLVDNLSSTNPLLISEVRTLINEFCRITVLWDELWLGSLGQLSATVSERIKALASEVDRVRKNESLSAAEKHLLIHEKRDTIVKPLIHTIERLSEITNKAAETAHEQWFQETYGQLIARGLAKLKKPLKDEDLASDWQPFKQLHSLLYQRSQKKASHLLKMKDLSSVLASFTNTCIPLPGAVAKSDRQPITLQSVHPTVQILPTKTKPKKMAFLGSDGQKYTYLFKGLEDLHLDERIMQLLNIVNDMLVSKGNTDSECSMYRARNYSVTPLGLRSGLIAWVDGCVPLFSLYKRWQVREAAAQSKPNGASGTVLRPSELLYSKLLPLLKPLLEDRGLNPKEVKISEVEKIRKDWPQSALISATKQLISETPSSLVAKEMWCHSTSTTEWWGLTQTYCRSVAVMSAIGYILGLGDRHLDNLLLDLDNGEIVHIDYNVCFDKGKSLRVPERVPFRLTSNVVAAMGATGVEGIFRSACEHTIKSMRLGKETLLTLLEAFVYDPLVDWTVGGETGLAGAFYGGNYAFGDAAKDYRRRKKQMERDITRSMFSIRVTEMKTAWLQNKDEMSSCLTDMSKLMKNYKEESTAIDSCNAQLVSCKDMLKYIEQLKKEGGQAIAHLIQQFSAHQKLVNAKEECMKSVHALSEDLGKYNNLHKVAIDAVTGSAIEELQRKILSTEILGTGPSSITRPYLQSAAQITQLDEAEKLHSQLMELAERRQLLMLQCIQSLLKYGTRVSMFQAHIYSNNHVMEDCMQAISHIQQEFSVTSCASVAKAFSHRSRKFSNSSLSAKVSASERTLHAALEADVTRLNKIVEKSELDLTDISELLGTLEMRLEAISRYQSLHGSEGHRTLLFIVLPKLAELTKKYLVMENTASRSEQRLHSLTSRDGDWFLDELAWVNDNLLEYIRMTTHHPPQSDTPDDSGSDDGQQMMCSPVLCNIVAGVKEVYASLQDLVLNFQQIILPDVLTSLVKEDAEVLRVVDSLDKEILKGHDLDTLGSKLENMLRNIIFGTKVIDSKTFDEVRELRGAFSRLCLPADTCSPMTKGAMVTKAFSGLFDRVFEEYSAVMLNLDKLQIPKSWRKVDVIREAGALQLTQFNDKTKNILADLFFIKQLAAMAQFFSIAKRYASIFIVVEPIAVESYDALSKPIKSFVADFVRKQILGVASQSAGYFVCEHLSDIGLDVEKEIALKDFGATSRVSIDDLCKKGLDKRTQTGTQLSQANTLISNFETAWKRQDVAKRLIRSRGLMEALISQQTKYLTCYQWLHEDLLPAASTQDDVNQPTRKELLTQLRSSLSVMVQSNSSYIELSEKVSAAEGQITQRLKWNAGANPKLASVLTRFEAAQAARSSLLQTQTNFMKELSTYSHSVLHLETMRSNSQDAVNLESKCNQLISRCLDVCKNLEGDSQINEQQRLMMSLMSKGDRQKTGNAFLGRAHDSVQSHSSSLMSKIKGLKRSVGVIQEKYQSHVSTMQFVTLNAHHKLISEVRAVLKTLAKEEMDDGGNLGCWVQQYLKDYKVFSEQLAKVIKLASNESLKDQLSANIETLLAEVQQDVESIFTRLIDIAKPLAVTTANNEKDKTDKPTTDDLAAGQELDISTSTSASANKDVQNHAEKIPRDPKTGKVVQERNSYAVSVWRRVKMKLDGRELDPSKKMSVTDQVSYIINEASDIKNLAQMYEGWTSWV